MLRLAVCSLALAACAGRATPRATPVPRTSPAEAPAANHGTYELCRDPQFQCMPAPTKAEQVDTNLSVPPTNHLRG